MATIIGSRHTSARSASVHISGNARHLVSRSVTPIPFRLRTTSREAVLQAREWAATEMLQRVLGDKPEDLARVLDLLRRTAEVAPWAGYGVLRAAFARLPLAPPWVDLWGEPRTWCMSTEGTATLTPGRSAAPTRWRSCC